MCIQKSLVMHRKPFEWVQTWQNW